MAVQPTWQPAYGPWVGRLFIGIAAVLFLLTAFNVHLFDSVKALELGLFFLAIGLIF